MSKPEIYLWDALRKRGASGFRLRRQHPIGPYVLDFFCFQAKLAIEVDGSDHGLGEQPKRDARRDAWLAGRGITTLRIPAYDVFNDLDGVFTTIEATLASSSPSGGSDSATAER